MYVLWSWKIKTEIEILSLKIYQKLYFCVDLEIPINIWLLYQLTENFKKKHYV